MARNWKNEAKTLHIWQDSHSPEASHREVREKEPAFLLSLPPKSDKKGVAQASKT
jgi:hypothetical protein